MAERFGFFNSVNGDRIYDAADVARFLKKFFTNGVFNNSLQVSSNDNMTVSVDVGTANIEGYSYELDEKVNLDIEEADSTLSRIDSVILRLDLTNRQIILMLLPGSYATNPSQPSIIRNSTIYDLRLSNISVPANSSRITADMIIDTRFSSDCGNVTQAVLSLSTDDIFKQYDNAFKELFEQMQNLLDTDAAGVLQNEINTLSNKINENSENEWEVSELNKEELEIYNENQNYLVNKKGKQLFNGIIPRYENLLNYSSEEQVIGTYMNKTLYRRVISGTCNKTYERTDIKGIDKIINYCGVCRVSGQAYEQNGYRPFPYIGQNVAFAINSYNDQRITFSSNWDNNWYECVLVYTKVAD